ncbi:hypothetical protein AVEN_62940-1 [Araneus ventricosus]|uniref:Uncharacterized protein n=1 Tax=Araneus ventricosus TaxID=182803 RepID=A0A4Y2LBB7_ARAVE|nr:hypothetical protein AVEN_62940-1 [Araneus ventricosus]
MIINERKEGEENERRNEEIQIAERKHQEEIAERKIQMGERRRSEEQEYEERKRKDEMEFELQKIRFGAEDQIKCKVSQEVKDHFIDDWSKLNSPDDLVEKLDDDDTLRSTFRSNQPRSSFCLLKTSVAQKLKLEPAVNKIYGFGNQKMPALTSIGRIKADIEVDNVKAESLGVYVAPDDAQSVDLIIG